jgi:hypothetical protein
MRALSILSVSVFLLISHLIVIGQQISEKACSNVFDLTKNAFKIVKIYREDVYGSDCDFEFTTDEKITVLVTIEKFVSDIESKAEVKRQWEETISRNKLKMLESADNKCGYDEIQALKLAGLDNWNDAYLNKSKGDYFLLLRRNNFVINMFSINNSDVLLRIEKIINLVKLDQ